MTLYEHIQREKTKSAQTALVSTKAQNLGIIYAVDEAKAERLKFTIAEADFDISNIEQDLEDLEALLEVQTANAIHYRQAGDTEREARAMKSVLATRKQINRAEKARARAMFNRREAFSKLYA